MTLQNEKGKHTTFRSILPLLLILTGAEFDLSQVCAQNIHFENAFPNLTFNNPLFLTHAGDGSNRIFVVEKAGIIKVFTNDHDVTVAEPFLDIRDRVNDSGLEMGLLGLAFHPNFTDNGYFYVNYTSGNALAPTTIISRFSVNPGDPNQANKESEAVILQVSQPLSSHNGGMLQFGMDHYLYIGLGDGGGVGDPRNNAQNPTNLFGSILRIDVDTSSDSAGYGIPPENPFAGNNEGLREEIWAYGFRNPWRFSIDEVTGQLWVGDVGQYTWEEIDLVDKGKNYGWNILEGGHCYDTTAICDSAGLAFPVFEYKHSLESCSAVTGGYVYRGSRMPELSGAYIFGDYCTGDVRMLRYENGHLSVDSLLSKTELNISSFGVDQENELYIIDLNAAIYRFSAEPPNDIEAPAANSITFSLDQNYPNPFNPTTTIRYTLASTVPVKLEVFNLLGQRVALLTEGVRTAGTYMVTWDASEWPSGVYLYRLEGGKQVFTRKLTLLK